MRRTAFLAAALSVLLAGAASAQSPQDSVVRQLLDQGWSNIEVQRTLLGRVRIQAETREREREIVLNPRTGIILRDYIALKRNGRTGLSDIFDNVFVDDDRSGSNSGSSSKNSGSGSSNSGSGSDNSGRGRGRGRGGDDDDDDD